MENWNSGSASPASTLRQTKAPQAPRKLVRRYHLTYAQAWHGALLESVQVEGRCGAAETDSSVPVEDGNEGFPESTGCARLPAMKFGYSHVTPYTASGTSGTADLPGFEGFDERVTAVKSSPPHSVDEELSDLFDVDADGLPDLLVTAAGTYGAGHGVFFNGATGEANTFGPVVKMSVAGVLGADANTISLKNLNVAALDLDGDGISDLLHMPKVKTYAVYGAVQTAGAWSWKGRAVDTADGLSAKIDLGKDGLDTQVVDVDFDGLVDVVVTTGTEVQTYFSLGRYPGGDGRFGQAVPTGPATATLSTEPVRTCVPWSATPVRFSDPDIKLSDMNGDGIADIVRIHQGEIIYWPGRGNGLWGTGKRDDCPAGSFGANRHVTMAKAPFYSDVQGQGLRLDDVNGDGLSDLVEIRFGEIDVWLNADGNGWTERHIIKGTPQSPGFMNRVRLVDVNGSGTRDVLWGTASNYQYIDLAGGSRPSVLTKVENGLGKTTTLSYSTSTAEMLAATQAGKPWKTRMPTVAHVVKTVVETSHLSLVGTGVKQRVTEYSYADPIYEGRQREFRGFQKAAAKRLGDANSPTDITETTFLLGECVDEDPNDGISACAISERWRDNPREALKGLPQLTERRDESGNYLSTELSVYKLRRLYTGLDGREVRHGFEFKKYAALYDTANFVAATSTPSTVGLVVERYLPGVSDTQEKVKFPFQSGDAAITLSRVGVDLFGNRLASYAYGCIEGCPGGDADEIITTHTAPTRPDEDPTGWLWRTGSSYVEGSVYFLGQLNPTEISYSVQGAPVDTYLTLTDTLGLDRFHETSGSVAPTPSDASSDGQISASSNSYDEFGNLTRETGASSRCRDVVYDSAYKQLPTSEKIYTSGCDGDWLATNAGYDRGLEQVTIVRDMNDVATYVAYDGLGRLTTIRRPRPDGQSAENTTPSVKLTYYLPTDLGTPSAPAYHSIVRTETQDQGSVDTASYLETWSYVDGFGQTLVTISEADAQAGDAAGWIASGRVTFDAKGAVEKKYLDSFYSGPEGSFDLQASASAPAGSQSYDAFGRQRLTRDLDGTVTLESFYHALSTDLWDAADREDTTHLQTYATETKDGHGRTAASIERFKEGTTIRERETTTTYLPTGQPQKITRKLGGTSNQVVRWMRYDSLGRMVLNVEPNTSTGYTDDPTSLPSTLKGWRYAYNDAGDLVGTSDARGCGVNFEYDTAGRLLLEDYSPCEAQHAAYSTPNLTNRTGIEVQYLYDSVPSDAPSGFFTSSCLNAGRLVAVYDRASVSMSCHDPRGRVGKSAVRVAKPGTPDEDLDNRYAPRWYSRVFVFDAADREIAATTGATNGNLQGTTESQTGATNAVTTQYSARGTVQNPPVAATARCTLLYRVTQTASWPRSCRATPRKPRRPTPTAARHRRTDRILTDRSAPSGWTSPPSNYLPAPSYTSNHQPTYQHILQDDNFTYDIVGNPTVITDSRVADEWPAGAKPVTRVADYDDLYRLVSMQYQFAASDDTWISPFDAENSGTPSLQDPRRALPSPHVSFAKRLLSQSFSYDWLGNTSATDDDADGFYDRSLGTITNGPLSGSDPKPYQLTSASNTATGSPRSGSLDAAYDDAGNLKRLQVDRNGPCIPSGAHCNQVFAYRWDEVGRLADARRWDVATLPAMTDPLPTATPDAHLKYAYDAGDQRVLKTSVDENETERHTVYVFETLELRRAAWITTGTPDYELTEWTEVAFLYSHGVRLARLAWDETDVPTVAGGQMHILLEAGDHLGSTSIVIDKATGELVERGTYQAYGGTESDYRPGRWKGFREDYGFTGKEEDVEVGLQYFGKRYYAPL
ncbi:MAG: toxin TcdB middle/N-terminal domain-containing protein, partial [Polyangiaceae bacterium]